MKVIYIAGPYNSDKGEYHVRMNIREAEKAALFVWKNGAAALCPHKNTSGFNGAHGMGHETWMKGDLELLSRCDAIYIIPGWDVSPGTLEELDFAHKNNMTILETRLDVLRFLGLAKEDQYIGSEPSENPSDIRDLDWP